MARKALKREEELTRGPAASGAVGRSGCPDYCEEPACASPSESQSGEGHCTLTCPECGASYSRLPGYRCPRCGHAFEACVSCQGCGAKAGPRAGSVTRILDWLSSR